MRASSVLNFQLAVSASLRRPWQTYRDGQIWYGQTKLGSKRHPLTTKQGNKHFYKGTGSSGYGKSNRNGDYVVNWNKVRTYVVPSALNSTELNALVSPNTPEIKEKYIGYHDGPKNPELAFQKIIDFIELGENYNNSDLEQAGYYEEIVHPDIVKSEFDQETAEAELNA